MNIFGAPKNVVKVSKDGNYGNATTTNISFAMKEL